MPLLFIILLENAFKHGVENLRADAFVAISLKSNQQTLVFDIRNNFDPEEVDDKVGIGLKNLRRRLELAYPDRHDLSVQNSNGIFKAKLDLQL